MASVTLPKANMAADSDSWTTWLEIHGPALLLFARQWAASRADAEDILQEAFIRFWKSRDRVAEPEAYLYTCVKHCALDAQRGSQRQRTREEAAARPEADIMFTGPIEQERRSALEAALRNLPESQAEVLVLKIWGGLSFPQIATALQIPPNTAASRYRYALAALREQLAEEPMYE